MTQKFQSYEKKIMREYLRTIRDVKGYNVNKQNSFFFDFDGLSNVDRGTHNTSTSQLFNAFKNNGQSINTNLTPKENLLISHLPIMSKPF